ncbi:MAG: type II secretion system protein [Armatimonadota bacterium]
MRRILSGFTLIEMLIVITVIALLALIVIPNLQGAIRRSRETGLRANLRQLRLAVAGFKEDTGGYPTDLNQLLWQKDQAPSLPDQDGAGNTIDKNAFRGTYLLANSLPPESFATDQQWGYDPATGEVHSTSTLIALDGTVYNTW